MTQTLVIGPEDSWQLPSVREAVAARGLISFFLWKDLRVRYRQTFMGVLWVILQPALEMIVFTVVFGQVFGKTIAGVPYPLFAYAGLLPWTYMSIAITSGTQSLVAHAEIVKRIYFPRFLLPVANAMAKLIDLAISLLVLVVCLLVIGIPLSLNALLLIPVLFLLFFSAAGASLWLSALHAVYRDVGLIVPYFLRLSMFLTPVVYPLDSLSPKLQTLLWINPLTSAVELFRAALLPGHAIDVQSMLLGCGMAAILFVTGFLFFQKTERHILDIL